MDVCTSLEKKILFIERVLRKSKVFCYYQRQRGSTSLFHYSIKSTFCTSWKKWYFVVKPFKIMRISYRRLNFSIFDVPKVTTCLNTNSWSYSNFKLVLENWQCWATRNWLLCLFGTSRRFLINWFSWCYFAPNYKYYPWWEKIEIN